MTSLKIDCLCCQGLGYINPSPFNKLFNCPDCKCSPELPEYPEKRRENND